MYYLAHLYLSQNCPYTTVGAFLTNAQRSWDYSACDEKYIKGVRLHQTIEEFSLSHPIIQKSLKRFSKNSKLSSKALFILYDHLLAANWKNYSDISLEDFSANIYNILMDNCSFFPYKVKHFLPCMVKSNWLVQLRTLQGTNKSYQEMGKITSKPWNMDSSLEDFMNNYSDFKKDFEEFFPLLINHVLSTHPSSERIIKLKVEDEKEEILRLKLA